MRFIIILVSYFLKTLILRLFDWNSSLLFFTAANKEKEGKKIFAFIIIFNHPKHRHELQLLIPSP